MRRQISEIHLKPDNAEKVKEQELIIRNLQKVILKIFRLLKKKATRRKSLWPKSKNWKTNI